MIKLGDPLDKMERVAIATALKMYENALLVEASKDPSARAAIAMGLVDVDNARTKLGIEAPDAN